MHSCLPSSVALFLSYFDQFRVCVFRFLSCGNDGNLSGNLGRVSRCPGSNSVGKFFSGTDSLWVVIYCTQILFVIAHTQARRGVVIFLVTIRKAPRRIHEDERRLGQRSSAGFPPLAPTMQAGQDSWA